MLQIRGDADRRAVTVCDLRHIVQPLRILNEDFITLVQQDEEQETQRAMPPLVMMISVFGS